MKTYYQYNMFNGVNRVAENGNLIYKHVFGLANRKWNISNTTDTKVIISLASKPLMAKLMLIHKNIFR